MTSLDPTKANLLISDDIVHEMNEVVESCLQKAIITGTRLLLTNNIFHQNKHPRTVSITHNIW